MAACYTYQLLCSYSETAYYLQPCHNCLKEALANFADLPAAWSVPLVQPGTLCWRCATEQSLARRQDDLKRR